MARVHRLQHVECLGAAHLAQDDAVGPHAQRVAHQRALRDFALVLDIRWARFQAHDVRLAQLQLCRVFDRHDPFAGGNEPRDQIEQGGLAATGAARDQDVDLGRAQAFNHPDHRRRHAFVLEQVLYRQRAAAEAADRQDRPVDGQRRDDGVYARAVRQARIDHRARFVDPAPHARDDLLDDLHQVGVVVEGDVGQF